MYQYNVITYFENSRVTAEDNRIEDAICNFITAVKYGWRCDFVDGFTGEVYASVDNGNIDWCTSEMKLMLKGFRVEHGWGV